MSTKDLLISESGNGGDLAVINNDLALADQLLQQVYLALFGGNVEASTLGNETDRELRNDWWGNSLLFADSPNKQFNSKTEQAIRNNTLNSTGRIKIQMAAESDLAYLKTLANITVAVAITSVNKLEIMVNLTQPSNKQSLVLQVLWDNASNEMIINKII